MKHILALLICATIPQLATAADPTPCEYLDPPYATEWSLKRCGMNKMSDIVYPPNPKGLKIISDKPDDCDGYTTLSRGQCNDLNDYFRENNGLPVFTAPIVDTRELCSTWQDPEGNDHEGAVTDGGELACLHYGARGGAEAIKEFARMYEKMLDSTDAAEFLTEWKLTDPKYKESCLSALALDTKVSPNQLVFACLKPTEDYDSFKRVLEHWVATDMAERQKVIEASQQQVDAVAKKEAEKTAEIEAALAAMAMEQKTRVLHCMTVGDKSFNICKGEQND